MKTQVQQKFNPEVTLVANQSNIPGSYYQWAVGLIHALGGRQDMIVDTLKTPPQNDKK